MQDIKHQVQHLWDRYQKYAPAAFFIGGFLFDVLTLGRIDHWLTIVQQGTFLFLCGLFLSLMLFHEYRPLQVPRWLNGLWNYRIEILHFLFGGLLSAFTLFYFKSSSIFASFIFMLILVALLLVNELPRFHNLGLGFKFALLSLCVISYFSYVVPIGTGRVGFLPLLLTVLASGAVMAFITWLYAKKGLPVETLRRQVIRPSLLVMVVFLGLYWLRWIPPVPISVQYMGIYHSVGRDNEGRYTLSHERPWWRFWHHGDQKFLAQPGDRIFAFARIFSPTSFNDQVQLHWLMKDPRHGWQTMDKIQFPIRGGRDEGFRGYAYKSNYQVGSWRVQVETLDGHEIGRIYFTVETVPATEAPREFQTDLF